MKKSIEAAGQRIPNAPVDSADSHGDLHWQTHTKCSQCECAAAVVFNDQKLCGACFADDIRSAQEAEVAPQPIEKRIDALEEKVAALLRILNR